MFLWNRNADNDMHVCLRKRENTVSHTCVDVLAPSIPPYTELSSGRHEEFIHLGAHLWGGEDEVSFKLKIPYLLTVVWQLMVASEFFMGVLFLIRLYLYSICCKHTSGAGPQTAFCCWMGWMEEVEDRNGRNRCQIVHTELGKTYLLLDGLWLDLFMMKRNFSWTWPTANYAVKPLYLRF